MRQPPDFYNSPEKARVRQQLWLPATKRAVTTACESYPWRRPKYLTVCGRDAWDLELFVKKEGLFEIRDVRAIDTNAATLEHARAKFPELKGLQGRFEDIVRSQKHEPEFPFDVINADLNGNCFDLQELTIPLKLCAVQHVCEVQAKYATSFTLLLTFEGSHQRGRDGSDRLVTSVLRDHATRLGSNEGYFRMARHGIAKNYDRTMLEVIPSVVLRMAGELGFDARLDSKVTYRPSNYATKVRMIGFVIDCQWAGAAPSVPFGAWSVSVVPKITERQRESVALPVADVAAQRAPRRPRKAASRRTGT